tara:strand:- start:1857 stop:3155 length:1299 start_codon:yes stop_codon:yes gene_type:complete
MKAAREFPRGASIRDSEVEETLKMFTGPIFKVAGLDPEKLHLYVIVDPDLNAAATTRYTILLNTGLLIKAKNAKEVVGVLAHETGHIAGGHIARREEMIRKSSKAAMASVLVGALAAVMTGNAEPVIGMAMAGSQLAQDTFLHYSRGQESSADQAAVRFMETLKWPSSGLLSFMQVLEGQELLSASMQDAYNRTHPLSQDRVSFLKHYVASVQHRNHQLPPHFEPAFQRLKVKLEAFLSSPIKILTTYSSTDESELSMLARAIAYFRNNQLEKALPLMKKLRKIVPNDPYYLDLEAQMYFEKGRLVEATQLYKQALKYKPKDALMNIAYAHALIEQNKTSTLHPAESALRIALQSESENPFIWRLLARIYGQQNKKDKMLLALAEEAFAQGNYKLAISQSARSMKALKDTQDRLRAQDIHAMATHELKEQGT